MCFAGAGAVLTGPIVGWFWQWCCGQHRAVAGSEPAVLLAMYGAGAAGGFQDCENPLVMPPVPWLLGAWLCQFSRQARVLGVSVLACCPASLARGSLAVDKAALMATCCSTKAEHSDACLPPCPERIWNNRHSIPVCCLAGYLCCSPAAVSGACLAREQLGLK